MLEPSLFSTADLLDATLTLVELEEAALHDEEAGLPGSEAQDAALGYACDRFEYLIESSLAEGDSAVLEDALDTLMTAEKGTACGFLESAIEAAACKSFDTAGNLVEVKLIPVIVSKEHCHEPLPGQQCKVLASMLMTHFAAKNYLKVTVSPRLKDPEEIYALRFHEVHELNQASSLNLRYLVTQDLSSFSHMLWHPALRFVVVQTVTELSGEADSDEDAIDGPTQSVSPVSPGAVLGSQQEGPRTLARVIAHELAVTYGTPLICGTVNNIYEARKEAMVMYAHKVAHSSIDRQLNAAGVPPVEMMMTFHTPEDLGPESEIRQIRVALLGSGAKLLAGHIIECNDWLTSEDSGELVSLICEWAGLVEVQQANQVIEILEDENTPPFFCMGETWGQLAPNNLRLEQELFD